MARRSIGGISGSEIPAGMSLGDMQFSNNSGGTPMPSDGAAAERMVQQTNQASQEYSQHGGNIEKAIGQLPRSGTPANGRDTGPYSPDFGVLGPETQRTHQQSGVMNTHTGTLAQHSEYDSAKHNVSKAQAGFDTANKKGLADHAAGTAPTPREKLSDAQGALEKYQPGTQVQLTGTINGENVNSVRTSSFVPGTSRIPASQEASVGSQLVEQHVNVPHRVAQGFSANEGEALQQQAFVRDFTEKAGGLAGRLTDADGRVLASAPMDYPSIKSYVDAGGTPKSYADAASKLDGTAQSYAAFNIGATQQTEDEQDFSN